MAQVITANIVSGAPRESWRDSSVQIDMGTLETQWNTWKNWSDKVLLVWARPGQAIQPVEAFLSQKSFRLAEEPSPHPGQDAEAGAPE